MGYRWYHKVLRPGRGGKGAGPGEHYLELYPDDVLVARFPGRRGREGALDARSALPPRYDDVCCSRTAIVCGSMPREPLAHCMHELSCGYRLLAAKMRVSGCSAAITGAFLYPKLRSTLEPSLTLVLPDRSSTKSKKH